MLDLHSFHITHLVFYQKRISLSRRLPPQPFCSWKTIASSGVFLSLGEVPCVDVPLFSTKDTKCTKKINGATPFDYRLIYQRENPSQYFRRVSTS
jgi:hypothetical protein